MKKKRRNRKWRWWSSSITNISHASEPLKLIKPHQNSHPSELSPQVQLQHIRQLHLLLTDLALAALAALAAPSGRGHPWPSPNSWPAARPDEHHDEAKIMAQKCGVPRGSEVLKGIVSKSTKESVSLLGRIRPTCSRLGAFCSCRAVPSVRLCPSASKKKHGPKQSGKPK